jgi:excisionase family DNA binding protein
MACENKNQLLTVREVCQLLRISRGGLYGLVRQGIVPRPIKLGRVLRWRTSDIEKALDALAAKQAPHKGEANGSTEAKRQRKRKDA